MAIGSDTFPAFAVIHRKCLSFCLSSEKIFSENDNRRPCASYNNKILGGVYCMINRYNATAKIVLAHSSRKSKIDGRRPIQLRIIYNRRPKYYTLPYAAHEEEFVKIFKIFAFGIRYRKFPHVKPIRIRRIGTVLNDVLPLRRCIPVPLPRRLKTVSPR